MSSPNRDEMRPGSGKLLKSDDTTFDLTTMLAQISSYMAGSGIPVNTDGGGGTGGDATYSNIGGDFTATANSGAKTITLSSYASAILSAGISAKNIAAAAFFQITSGGVVTQLPTTNVAFAANVITLADMAANFAAGDTVLVFIPGPEKAYVAASDYYKMGVSDGTNTVTIETAGADGASNTANSLTARSRLYSFNGTTWDRIRSAVTAISSTFTGFLNALPWAIYHATPTTRTDGQGGPLETDASGNMQINSATRIRGEDETYDVMKTQQQCSFTNITTQTTTTLKSGAGQFMGVLINTPVASAVVTIYDNTAGSGTLIGTITFPAALLSSGPVFYGGGIAAKFATGLTIVTSGATMNITALYN